MGSYYRDVYKFAGTRPMFQSNKIRKAPMRRGLYSLDEVTDLIVNQNYIPVATANELNILRTATTQTMGAGTIWEGEYLTGLDKKYVQVDDLDLVGFANWTPIGPAGDSFLGTYDGNELTIDNLTINSTSQFRALFGTAIDVKIKNCVLANVSVTSSEGFVGSLVAYGLGADFKITNCHASGSVSGTDYTGGIIGTNYDASGGVTGGEINNCSFTGTVSGGGGTQAFVGGIAGISRGLSAKIINSHSHGSVTSSTRTVGGICGQSYEGEVTGCYSTMNVTSNATATNSNAGGLIGYVTQGTQINKCYATGKVLSTSTGAAGDNVGGLIGAFETASSKVSNSYATGEVDCGRNRAGGAIGWFISGTAENCYSVGLVSGVSNVGGFSGTAGTFTNCYYDTDTSGQSDTGKGLPRTTLQMQQGTADSFILPAGGIDGDSLAANAMYTGWSVAIWKFTPLDKYPTLL